jgi:putative oxidoreductase
VFCPSQQFVDVGNGGEMGRSTDLGLLILRLAIGGTLAAHGGQKLFGWFGGPGRSGAARMMDSMGFAPGERNALLAGIGEFGGGTALAVGLGTGSAGAVSAGTMLVAGSVHSSQGFFAMNGGFELPANLGVAASAVSLTGPGRYSLDQLTRNVLNRPWMRVAAYAGALAGAVYVMIRRQPPSVETGTSEEPIEPARSEETPGKEARAIAEEQPESKL